MKNNMKYASVASFLFVFIMFSFALSIPQLIETKDGVLIVHNLKGGKRGKNLRVSLELVRTVGDINTLDENFTFHNPEDIALDSKGNLYILDSGNHRIQKFSPQGSFISSFGQIGQGPGDFNNPTSIEIDPYDTIYVADPRNHRICIFSSDSKRPKTIKLLNFNTEKVRYLSKNRLAVGGFYSAGMYSARKKALPKLLLIIDLNGNIQREIGDSLEYEKWIENWWGNRYEFDIDARGNFYFVFEHQNRIEKYNPAGKLLWRADRVLNFDIYNPKYMWEVVVGNRSGHQEVALPAKMAQGIAVDKKDKIWVLTFNRPLRKEEQSSEVVLSDQVIRNKEDEIEKSDAFKLEIFDGNGFLLGEIMLNHLANGIRIYEDFLFVWDVQSTKYYQYKIIDKI